MATTDVRQAVEGLALLAGLPEDERRRLAGAMRLVTLRAHTHLMSLEQPGDVVYVLLDGTVRVQVEQEDGGLVILAFLGPGDLVGEMSVLEGGGRSATVVAIEPGRAVWLDRATLKLAVQTQSVFAFNVLRAMSRRLRLADAQIEALATLDVPGRVAHQVLAFAREYGVPGPEGSVYIPLRLNQSDLASMVGASRERVNQVLVGWRQRGYVRIDNRQRITVSDLPGLACRL